MSPKRSTCLKRPSNGYLPRQWSVPYLFENTRITDLQVMTDNIIIQRRIFTTSGQLQVEHFVRCWKTMLALSINYLKACWTLKGTSTLVSPFRLWLSQFEPTKTWPRYVCAAYCSVLSIHYLGCLTLVRKHTLLELVPAEMEHPAMQNASHLLSRMFWAKS